MHLLGYSVIFLMGGVAAIIIMRLLFIFWGRSSSKPVDEQYLKRIANTLR
jgi:hypothetical protein